MRLGELGKELGTGKSWWMGKITDTINGVKFSKNN